MPANAHDIVMPKLGLTMTEGKLAEWKVSAGDRVEVGNTLFVVETEKVANEIDAESAGVVDAILVQEGETVPVGTPIARLLVSGADEAPAEAKAAAAPPATPAKTQAPAVAVDRRSAPDAPAQDARIVATPFARRLARERGIDLATIRGSGPRGRIKAADIEAQPSQPLRNAGHSDAAAGAFRFQLQLSSAAAGRLQDELEPLLSHKVPLAAIVAVAAAAAFRDESNAGEPPGISVAVRDAGTLRRAALSGADGLRLRAIVDALAEASSDDGHLPSPVSVEEPGLKAVAAFEPPLAADQMAAIGVTSSDTTLALSIAIDRNFGFRRVCGLVERLTHHLEHPLAMLATL